MARFMENGFPVGSKIRTKDVETIKEIFRDKEGVVTYPLKDYTEVGYGYGYFVLLEGQTRQLFVEEFLITFVGYPVPMKNWCRNKCLLLFEIDSKIATQLAEEKAAGDFPYGEVK